MSRSGTDYIGKQCIEETRLLAPPLRCWLLFLWISREGHLSVRLLSRRQGQTASRQIVHWFSNVLVGTWDVAEPWHDGTQAWEYLSPIHKSTTAPAYHYPSKCTRESSLRNGLYCVEWDVKL